MDTKKKVLVLLPVFDLGGAEKQGMYIADSMQKSGLYEVEVWAMNQGGGMLIAKLDELGLKHSLVGIPFASFNARLSRLKAYWKFLRLVRKSRFDIIIPFTYHCNVISATVARLAGVKKCVWFQIAMEYHIPLSFFEKLAIKLKPTYAANSLAAADFIAQKHGKNPSDVTFIPNPFEKKAALDTPTVWREKLNVSEDAIVMVMAANFYPEKDHATLLRGLSVLRRELPNLVLVFAGGLNPEAQSNKAKALAFDLGLGKEVRFIGSTNDIPGLLAAAQIGILSSRSEGSPNALIEYMGYGLPVIATNIPAISELLGKDYPFLFEVENVDDFVAKARMLILTLSESQQWVAKNKQHIEEKYTVSSNFTAFHQLINQA